MKKKVEASKIPRQMKDAVAMRAANMVSNRVKRSNIAKRMAGRLCKTLPAKLKEKGLTIILEEIFREEHYFVLELQVQHVDTIMVEKAKREKGLDVSTKEDLDSSSPMAGTLLDWTLKLMGEGNQRILEEEYLPAKVQEKLEKQMMRMMREKFENMNLKAEVKILKEQRQGRYFFTKLKAVRQEVRDGGFKNPINELRKKLSAEKESSVDPTTTENTILMEQKQGRNSFTKLKAARQEVRASGFRNRIRELRKKMSLEQESPVETTDTESSS